MISLLKWLIIGFVCGFWPTMIPFAILLLIANFLDVIGKNLEVLVKSLK